MFIYQLKKQGVLLKRVFTVFLLIVVAGTINISEAQSVTSNSAWQSFNISTQTGSFSVQFDLIMSLANTQGYITIQNGTVSDTPQGACIIYIHQSGVIWARNGSSYTSIGTVRFTAGTSYHFRMQIDVPNHIYSINITPLGGSEITLGTNFAFRTEQASVTQLTGWGFRNETATGSSLTVSNMTFTSEGGGDTTPPTVPLGLSSGSITQTGFDFSWTASTDDVGVTGYEVFKGGTSIGTTASTSKSITGLTAGTSYGMTVRARDAAGNWSAISTTLLVTTSASNDTQAPIVPSGLTAENKTQMSFDLSWNASTDNVGVTGYEAFKDGVSIGTTASTSISVIGLTAGTSYVMTVRARDAAGNWSAQSTALNVTTNSSGTEGATTMCKWKDNKKAALTITIDDNCWGDVPFVTSIVNPRGIKVTWELITYQIEHNPSFYGTWANWRTIPAMGMGHELGSHTVTHPDNPTVTPTEAEIRAELNNSKLAIEQNVPANGKCISIAYSSSWNNTTIRTIASEYYINGRGTNGNLNLSSPPMDYSTGGMWSLLVSDRTSANIDAAISQEKWFMWFSHEINDNGQWNIPTAVFTAFCDSAYSKRNYLWFGTQRDVSQYIYERNASTVQVVSSTTSQIVLNLTHSLSTAICDFDFPITLKTEVYSGWNDEVTVIQGSDTTTVGTVEESGKRYVYFDAIPNGGQIMLTRSNYETGTSLHNVVGNGRINFEAYPNPFNSGISIKSNIPVDGFVRVQIYNFTGNLIATRVNENRSSGIYNDQWDAQSLPDGLYFLRLIVKSKDNNNMSGTTNSIVITKKIVKRNDNSIKRE